MFDWNGEELENILWGEAGESDDHIVPYPNGSECKCPGSYGDHKKIWEEEVACEKPAEQKNHVAETDYHAAKIGCNSQYDTDGGVPATGVGSWPDLSISNSAKADQKSVEQSSKITEMTNYELSRDVEKPHLDEGSELYNQPEEREDSDFANYSWANIGSFDDFDRIFRFLKISDGETETNPIDRTVAHLLFHRPLESSLPTNLGSERKATAVMRLQGVFTEGYKDDPFVDIPCLLTEGNESISPCPDTSEKASNYETAYGEVMEVEASQ